MEENNALMVSHRSDHTNAEGVIVISSDSEEEEKE